MPPPDVSDLRRLNHLVGEDFYFLSYSILLTLRILPSRGTAFRDHRKLGHVVQFISDTRLLSVLDRNRDKPVDNGVDRELLFAAYAKAEMLKRETYKLLLSMHGRGLVQAEPNSNLGVVDVTLKDDAIDEAFFEDRLFEQERTNARTLRALVPRLSTLTMETFLEKVYVKRGVRAWAL